MSPRALLLPIILIAGCVYADLDLVRDVYRHCQVEPDPIKCLKVNALKIAARALQAKSIGLLEGVSVVRDQTRDGRGSGKIFREDRIGRLNSSEIDGLLADTASRFFQTHSLKFDFPKLGERNEAEGEGRGKKKKGHVGPFIAALAIKSFFLAMAYKGIAVISGAAILIGKLALMLAALLGLKKLVRGEEEKTTFEIVKHPTFSHGQTYSSSHEDIDERIYHNTMTMAPDEGLYAQEQAYRNQVPQYKKK